LKSPLSGVLLKNNTLTPNRLLHSQIKEWQQHQQQQQQQQHPRQPQQRRGGARGGESASASSKATGVTGAKLAEATEASSPSAVASLLAAASAISAAAAAPRSAPAPSAPAKRIFVEWKKHKPEPAPAITSAQLFHALLPFGAVEEEKTFVVFDRGAQKRQPFGFVEFRDAESAARAVAAKTIQIGAVAANASFAKAAR
jgi:hypothetical protein